MAVKQVLLVCTGNTCRSPMAQSILQEMLDMKEQGSYRVCSAGIAAMEGAPASWPALSVIGECGQDLSSHRGQRVDEELIASTDLVLTMSHYHSRYLLERYPEAAAKIFTLGEYAGASHVEVSDPIGGSLEDYRSCKRQLEELLARVCDRLLARP